MIVYGVKPAAVLDALGRDTSSGSGDYKWLRRRVKNFGELLAPGHVFTPPLNPAGADRAAEILRTLVKRAPKLFSTPPRDRA